MAYHIWEAFHWDKLEEAISPPLPKSLPTNFQHLCPNFVGEDGEEVAQEVDILEVVQATFFAMAATYVEELSVLSKIVGECHDATRFVMVFLRGLACHSLG